jgi:anti-sigma regulatory factor (Ser/Thr protein kinase)
MSTSGGGVTDQLLRLELGGSAYAPAAARRGVLEALARRPGPAAFSEAFLRVAELLASELVTNAIRHATGPVEVEVTAIEDGARVTVTDRSTTPPRTRPPAPHAPGGRGLRLVSTLASRWGCDPTPDGKQVWFELHGTPVLDVAPVRRLDLDRCGKPQDQWPAAGPPEGPSGRPEAATCPAAPPADAPISEAPAPFAAVCAG